MVGSRRCRGGFRRGFQVRDAEAFLQALQLIRHGLGGVGASTTLVCGFESHCPDSGFDRFEAPQDSLLPLLIVVGGETRLVIGFGLPVGKDLAQLRQVFATVFDLAAQLSQVVLQLRFFPCGVL